MAGQERMLTPKEVGDLLGRSHYTIVRWLKDGYLQGVKMPRGWRIEPSALDAFLAAHRQKPPATDATMEVIDEELGATDRQ